MASEIALTDELGTIRRDQLVSREGVSYRDFKRGLTPRYAQVWSEIAAGYVALALITQLLGAAHTALPLWLALVAAVPATVAYGYTVAYLHLFLHEAAHYNLLPGRRSNDRFANVFIGLLIGREVRDYRAAHFDHHRHLGTPRDTEYTYFDSLSLPFLLKSLTGVKLLEVVRKRQDIAQPAEPDAPASTAHRYLGPWLWLGAACHVAVLAIALVLGHWLVALSWTAGMALIFPFFAALRQVLEHRNEHASPDVDYQLEPHGAVNRLFGDGLLARTLGGAGFNRHLLHHWDPQVSYTRLPELERFLLETDMAELLRSRSTSYVETFRQLVTY